MEIASLINMTGIKDHIKFNCPQLNASMYLLLICSEQIITKTVTLMAAVKSQQTFHCWRPENKPTV